MLCLSLASLAFLLVGCSNTMTGYPAHKDIYANLAVPSAPPAFPDLNLALVLSENAKNSMKTLHRDAFSGFDAGAMVEKMYTPLRRNFKTVAVVERPEDARKANADLVVILDDYWPKYAFVCREERTLVFMTLDNQKIAEFKAAFEKTWLGTNVQAFMDLFSDTLNEQVETALRKSQALADFAKTRPAEARPLASAPESPAAPASKVYHSDVDQPAYSSPEKVDDFALVIGIDKYSTLPAADFAERDASAVREHLLAMGYPERNVVLLRGSQAGKAGIEKYVESWLPRNLKRTSRLFVYFSGHGAPDPRTGQAYLVPWDGDPQFLENTGYPTRRLYAKLDSLEAKKVFVVLDACFSGAGGRSVLVKGARPLVAQVDTGADASGKLIILAASAGDEITGTDPDQGHGLFTYYLLKGLAGEAKDPLGRVTVKSLHDYLTPKVQNAARRQNRDQTPALIGPAPAEAVLRESSR